MIGDNVELHTGVCIEKGVFGGITQIDDYSKLDNHCVVEHDVLIGRRCKLAGKTLLAGWARIGKDSFCGVSVSVAPRVRIGAGCKLSAGAVVTKDVEDGQHVSGNFAIDHEHFIQHIKNISDHSI
jgi:UDP-3-O-[3-hydroxymyristoyl] glucosamine N-acyltransferase